MAKLGAMPATSVIAGYKGKIDFYVHKGQACARKWPHTTGQTSTVRQTQNQHLFTYAQKSWKSYFLETKDLYKAMSKLANWRWHEYAYRMFRGRTPFGYRRLPFDIISPPAYPYSHLQYYFLVPWVYWVWEDETLWLMFMLDWPREKAGIIGSHVGVGVRDHWRKERGVMKFCGYEPSELYRPIYIPFIADPWNNGLNCIFGFPFWYPTEIEYQWPHFLQIAPLIFTPFEDPETGWWYHDESVSSGPVFQLTPPPLPEYFPPGRWKYPVKPLMPTWRYDHHKAWTPLGLIYRSWRWPLLPQGDPGTPYIESPNPLEDQAPHGYPKPIM